MPDPTETNAEPSTDAVAADADAHAAHDADRPPTADEERVAEQVARDVRDGAGEHFEEMAEIGADVRGEGQIVP